MKPLTRPSFCSTEIHRIDFVKKTMRRERLRGMTGGRKINQSTINKYLFVIWMRGHFNISKKNLS